MVERAAEIDGKRAVPEAVATAPHAPAGHREWLVGVCPEPP
ncbi:hypothetical protein [Chamaesiphon sp. VAR_48_metabat_135_sub]|nr:hypothetical protein [Chamaesiphon sp. VAR_48_metabat_135_sub]